MSQDLIIRLAAQDWEHLGVRRRVPINHRIETLEWDREGLQFADSQAR